MENIIVVAVKGIIIHDNKVLIIQRSADDEMGANTWEFAGGKIDFGEDLEDALMREIQEEVGLSVTVDKLFYAATLKANEYKQVVILTYSCSANSNTVKLSDEHINYLWADKHQMLKLLPIPIIDDLTRNSVWGHIFRQ